MKVVDLFAGAGGFSEGFRMAGIPPIEAIELNPVAAHCYNTNHGTGVCDARSIEGWLPRYDRPDVIIGGPPCQSFSTAGKQLGLDDPRGSLLFEFVRVVRECRPMYFVLENVVGLTQAQGIGALAAIRSDFGSVGYHLEQWVLNAYDYQVSQNRKRLFLVGSLAEAPIPLRPRPVRPPVSALATLCKPLAPQTSGTEQAYHSSEVIERYSQTQPGFKENVSRFPRVPLIGGSPTITASGRFIHPLEPRILTVREVARLQSFPDDYWFPESKVAGYRLVGNAVPPVLARAVARSITEAYTLWRKYNQS